jgi:hypothetical protein
LCCLFTDTWDTREEFVILHLDCPDKCLFTEPEECESRLPSYSIDFVETPKQTPLFESRKSEEELTHFRDMMMNPEVGSLFLIEMREYRWRYEDIESESRTTHL